MNLDQQQSKWKTTLAIFAFIIILASLVSTNFLASKIEVEERKKMELYANTLKKINEAEEGEEVGYYFDILNSEETIPLISVDENGTIRDFKNLPDDKALNEQGEMNMSYLQRQLNKMKTAYEPIPINLPDNKVHKLYYRGSELLNWLKWFPYVQLVTIALFLATAYYLFSEARKSEQNKVWVGMSKETAHQLGTPISSLLGWIEYLKLSEEESIQQIVPEMEKDIDRLELITDRFSKIGSKPHLESHNIVNIVHETVQYMQRRSPKRVTFHEVFPNKNIITSVYPPLFNWIIENLIKNSLDAMRGEGQITVRIEEEQKNVLIDLVDTGKGITGRNKNVVFRPGYSTKKRGWGLGLSLAKRIIEDYHNGKIYVLQSEKNKGTTIRIELDKMQA